MPRRTSEVRQLQPRKGASRPGHGAGAQPETPRAAARAHGDQPTHEQIATRAYEHFLARGQQHGWHDEDWFRAEQELRNGFRPTSSSMKN